LASRVLLKIVYLLVRRVLGLAALVFRRDLAKDAELGAPAENAVLRRHVGRIRYEPATCHRESVRGAECQRITSITTVE
jgi:hypothetical protein